MRDLTDSLYFYDNLSNFLYRDSNDFIKEICQIYEKMDSFRFLESQIVNANLID